MKNKIKQTSLEAFESIQSELGARQQEVFDVIKENGPISDQDIALALERQINTITPRRNELVKRKKVVCVGTKISRYTGRRVSEYDIK